MREEQASCPPRHRSRSIRRALGAFPEGKDKTFFDALQKICNIAHEACIGTIYGDMLPTTGGDVINLRKTLKCAVAFEAALSESSGETKAWLLRLWQKAGHGPKVLEGKEPGTQDHR